MTTRTSRTYHPYDNGGEVFIQKPGGLVRKTAWLPHSCSNLSTDPIAAAAEVAADPTVRAAFAELVHERKKVGREGGGRG